MARKMVISGVIRNNEVSEATTRAGTVYGLGRFNTFLAARDAIRALRIIEAMVVEAEAELFDHYFGELDDKIYASIQKLNATRFEAWNRQINSH